MDRTSPQDPITGRTNRSVKYLAGLADPKERRKEQAFLIEGVKMVEEALRDGLDVRQVVASPSLAHLRGSDIIRLAENAGVHILWISERLMDAVAESKTPQPVMAVVGMRKHDPERLLAEAGKLVVLCHRLQDPGNLGTIIRTAEAAGAGGIAVTAGTVDPYNPKCVRASMGSILRLPVANVEEPGAFLAACGKAGYRTVAMTLEGERTLYEADLRGPTAIIVGQEGAGLPGDLAVQADLRIRSPMAQTTESLNAAVSAAVVLYEAVRQRTQR